MHLVYLIHGLFGNAGHLASMEQSILDALPEKDKDNILIYRTRAMSAVGTFDGVANNAHKLLEELLPLLSKYKVTHLSVVGYSMGGLCGRYLIGLLEQAGVFAKIQPVLYATFATPHLGSQYPRRSFFGYLFNTIGSRITGNSGFDLFRRSTTIDDLADPEREFYQGLAKFTALYLFANTRNDRTVPFWTSYISPKNPFDEKSLRTQLHESLPFMVNMNESKIDSSSTKQKNYNSVNYWQKWALSAIVKALIPFFLIILMTLMSIVSVLSFLKQKTPFSFRPKSNPGKVLLSDAGDVLDQTLQYGGGSLDSPTEGKSTSALPYSSKKHSLTSSTSSAFSSTSSKLHHYGSASSGLNGLLETSPANLNLSPRMLRNIESLNKLPWVKYAVKLNTISTHGTVVDRRGASREGKALLNFFGELLAESHADVY